MPASMTIADAWLATAPGSALWWLTAAIHMCRTAWMNAGVNTKTNAGDNSLAAETVINGSGL